MVPLESMPSPSAFTYMSPPFITIDEAEFFAALMPSSEEFMLIVPLSMVIL